jgi:hypothetical protein
MNPRHPIKYAPSSHCTTDRGFCFYGLNQNLENMNTNEIHSGIALRNEDGRFSPIMLDWKLAFYL